MTNTPDPVEQILDNLRMCPNGKPNCQTCLKSKAEAKAQLDAHYAKLYASDPDEVNLCKGCNTMKHTNTDGLCGRCAGKPEAEPELREAFDKEFLSKAGNEGGDRSKPPIHCVWHLHTDLILWFEKYLSQYTARAVRETQIEEMRKLDSILPAEDPAAVSTNMPEDSLIAYTNGMMVAYREINDYQEGRIKVLQREDQND